MENEINNKWTGVFKTTLRIVIGLFLFIFLLLAGLILALRQPSIQTSVVQKASTFLSSKIGHQVTIGRVDIRFFNKVILEKVKVLDRKKEELFYIGEAEASLSGFSLSNYRKLTIEQLKLVDPHAAFIRYKTADSMNLSVFLASIKKLIKSDTTKTAKAKFDFKINSLAIQNGHFRYENQKREPVTFGMDYQHLDIDSINVKISDIAFLGDTIQTRITDLQAHEHKSNANLKNLDARMVYAPTFWEFAELDLRLNNSNLRHYVRFDYKRFWNFISFNDSVQVTTALDSSAIFSDDIAIFAPQLKDWNEKILISGEAKGFVKRFNAKNIDLYYGEKTHIVGNLSADGLPRYKETFADIKLKPSVILARDLKKFIPAKNYALVERLGTVKLEGDFLGFYSDFVAHGSFATALGKVVSDINLKINKNPDLSTYTGYLKTDKFALGKFIGDPRTLQAITMNGKVKGTGFNLASARLNLDATIQSVGILGYNYRNITIDATLSQKLVAGKLKIYDPNVELSAEGTINLSQASPTFDLTSNINRANLQALKLLNKNFVLQTNTDLNFTGLTLDDLLGQATFQNTTLTYGQEIINFDSVAIKSARTNGQRSIDVSSNILDFSATGNFEVSRFIADFSTFVREDILSFKSNQSATETYYRQKKTYTGPDYELGLIFRFKKGNPFLKAYVPELYLAENTLFTGNFRQGPNSIFNLYSHLDTLIYGKYRFYNNDFEINNSKLQTSPTVLAGVVFSSRNQQFAAAAPSENLFVEGIWNDSTINFSTNIAQTGSSNKATVTGNISFPPDKVQIVLDQSQINILGKQWNIRPNNSILIGGAGKEIEVNGLELFYGNQSVNVTGQASRHPEKELVMEVKNFQLENLVPLLNQQIYGVLNARASASNLFNKSIILSKLTVDSLRLDTIYIGEISGFTDWDKNEDKIKVDLGVFRSNMRVVSVTGDYNPQSEDNPLNLLAVMDEAPIKLVEPLLKTLFSDLSGIMEGRVQINGRLNGPVLVGSAFVTNGRFRVNYLNTYYSFSDRIYFTDKDIAFRNIRVRDMFNNSATIAGIIQHQGFQNMELNLKGDFRKFMVLNTTRAENSLYYGTAIATGTASLTGTPSNLFITVNARSEGGTKMSIPLDGQQEAKRQSYIQFVNHKQKDSVATDSTVDVPRVDLAGINLNFNLGITDDAELEIIFDEETGDIVRGSGNGRINLNIDTRGEFTMDGQVEIVKGYYNFTLYNIIRKGFNIRPGGTITWNGDPYAGIMDLTATYTQRIVLPTSITQEQSNIRYPVTAVMDLEGKLLAPEIKLNLEFEDTPSTLETQINAYLADIRNNQDELNRQVFNLLILKRLSDPSNTAQATVGTQVDNALGLTSSLSQALSNQLGNLISQLDSNLEIDIGLDGFSNQQINDLQLRLSYSLFKGRLRLSHEGGLPGSNNYASNPSNPNYTPTGAEVPGSWRADVYLRADGKLRLKLEYNITPYSYSTSLGQTSVSSLRGSILHTERFDTFSELFARRKMRRRDRKATEKIIIDSDERVGL
ncbi:translocation/assembly module TamB domain-containing protein [Adhaeribacter radiodurans]|uniref:Translocation/assembly module TamB domain-containing protein n=1 Tax=Adhaeribacter radiodurans TaxID=2745197 RepID=A0A7L7L509_9BACT|nr:translocation/assembly module TamB domain-containing protein [Adhaeribacter radiodurans]QMU27886.1 translocation/assembly module TamB domain-containing protein [Adhaeribacter radiodurans]